MQRRIIKAVLSSKSSPLVEILFEISKRRELTWSGVLRNNLN